MGTIGCAETSIRNHHDTLRNILRRAQISSASRRQSEITHDKGEISLRALRSDSRTCLVSAGTASLKYRIDSKNQFTHSMPFPCHSHAVLLPCGVAKGLEFVFPYHLHSAAVSDSHLPCHAHAMLRPCRSSQGHGTARLEKNGMVGAWHGKCKSDTAALYKSNGKDTF